jgi:mRNA interferase MazF
MSEIKRGEIYWIDWNPSRGSEQADMRPGLVIQTDVANGVRAYPITIVIAISSRIKGYPSNVPIDPTPRNGLRVPSEVLTGQVLTISKDRIADEAPIGKLDDADLKRVEDTLAYMLGLSR